MSDFMIRLSSIDEIKQFIRIATLQPCGVQLASGTQTTSAKAYMGVFNLDFGSPLRCTVCGTEDQRLSFLNAVQQYVIEA